MHQPTKFQQNRASADELFNNFSQLIFQGGEQFSTATALSSKWRPKPYLGKMSLFFSLLL